jgi:RNA polymerase sigma-70 factor (ECF subfamily)
MTSLLPTSPIAESSSHPGAGPDAEVLDRLHCGDEDACRALVCRHSGRMLAVARRFLCNDEDADDAVQDAFLAAFRGLDKFQGNSTLWTWLHRIVVNACLMKLRAKSRSRAVPIDDLLPAFDEAGRHCRPGRAWPEQAPAQLMRKETRIQVRGCIDRLPKRHRAVLLLRDIEELDPEQTAQLLGIAPGAVKTRLHRARQALRTLVEPLVLEDPPA